MVSVCAACGNSMTPGERFCRVCGRQSFDNSPAAPGVVASASPVASPETNPKAIISLVCGFLFFIPLAFLAAIIFGHIALSEIRKSAGRLKGEGLAIAGLVLGYMWIVAIPVLLIVAAIAIPNLLRARIAANESSAAASVRTLNIAEVTYSQSHPDAGFTCSLSDLSGDRLIGDAMAGGQKSGYAFELTNCAAGTAGGPNVKYQVVATPITRNQSGVRAFCSDESAVVKVDSGGSAQGCLESGNAL